MRQIEIVFDINEETGEFKADVMGDRGHGCVDDVLAQVEEMVGLAQHTKLKPEYRAAVRVARSVKGRQR